MVRIVFGIFTVLHGLVHLLYFGQSQRVFELQPGLVWPDGSWAFSKLLDDRTTRMLASVFLVLAGIGFSAGGTGILARQPWWRPALTGAAAFSTFLYVVLWDGAFHNLDDKGAIGILINVAILVAVLLFQWPI
jgi:hypothetical protein